MILIDLMFIVLAFQFHNLVDKAIDLQEAHHAIVVEEPAEPGTAQGRDK